MRSPMLTFSHLPTFHGTPPDGVWHQQGSLARYVKNGVAAVVDVNGRVTILPSCLDLVVAYRDTLPECFAWAEGEVERLVGERATPTIQGNYRVVEQGEMPTNEWYTHRGYESKTIHLWTGRAGASVSAFPGRYWVCPTGPLLARFPTLAFPTQHVAMVAVLDAAYPADRAVAYIKSWADRPDGWSMCVDVPGVWEFHKCGKNVGNVLLMRTGWYAVTPDVCYQTFTEAADAVEGAAKVSAAQAARDLRERNHKAISAARLKDVHTNGGWKPPGDAGGGDALREVGGGRQRILVNNDGRVSLIDTSVPGGYSKLDFETAEEALEAADEQVASKTGYAPVISLVDLKPGDTIRHKGGGDALVVTANYGNRVTAARTADVTNPCEWQVWREK